MKKILALILVLATGIVFAENTIIAVVNNLPISLNSVEDNFLSGLVEVVVFLGLFRCFPLKSNFYY